MVQSLELYDEPALPLNVGFEEEISIKELSEKVAKIVGYEGSIVWDASKPDGQMRKMLSNKRMSQYNIQIQKTSLDRGILKTIKWYEGNNEK